MYNLYIVLYLTLQQYANTHVISNLNYKQLSVKYHMQLLLFNIKTGRWGGGGGGGKNPKGLNMPILSVHQAFLLALLVYVRVYCILSVQFVLVLFVYVRVYCILSIHQAFLLVLLVSSGLVCVPVQF